MFQREVRRWHGELFPEEYDFIYDSIADRKERLKGVSPMAQAHVERADAERAALGFGPLSISLDGPHRTTLAWVERMLREGRGGEMKAIFAERAEKARREVAEGGQAQPVGSSLDREIDRRLANGAPSGTEETEEDLAFRIMGALFAIMPQASTAKPFLAQARRLLPGRSAERYRALYRHALDAWVEAYGY